MRTMFTPVGPEDDGRLTVVTFGAKVEGPDGRWIDLNDRLNYQLEGSSFGERSVTVRTGELTNALVSGSFATAALPENITETVAVWVRGSSSYDVRAKEEALADAFTQVSYRFLKRVGNASEYWICLPASYKIATQREFLHAGISLFTATVPRRPEKDLVLTSADEL